MYSGKSVYRHTVGEIISILAGNTLEVRVAADSGLDTGVYIVSRRKDTPVPASLINGVRLFYNQLFQDREGSFIGRGCMTKNSLLGLLLSTRFGWNTRLIYREIEGMEHWYLLVDDRFIVDIHPSPELM